MATYCVTSLDHGVEDFEAVCPICGSDTIEIVDNMQLFQEAMVAKWRVGSKKYSALDKSLDNLEAIEEAMAELVDLCNYFQDLWGKLAILKDKMLEA